jgi:hypothetical protein
VLRMVSLLRAHAFPALGLLFTLNTLLLPVQVSAAAVNMTVDDSNAALFYQPTSVWSSNSDCTTCALTNNSFDQSQIWERTWHDATASDGAPVNISFSFTGASHCPLLPNLYLPRCYTGIAIYLFCIIPNHVPDVATVANYTFTLDGQSQSPYVHTPNDTSNVVAYNVSVLAVSGLPNTPHQVVMTLQPAALALFDSAVYT